MIPLLDPNGVQIDEILGGKHILRRQVALCQPDSLAVIEFRTLGNTIAASMGGGSAGMLSDILRGDLDALRITGASFS